MHYVKKDLWNFICANLTYACEFQHGILEKPAPWLLGILEALTWSLDLYLNSGNWNLLPCNNLRYPRNVVGNMYVEHLRARHILPNTRHPTPYHNLNTENRIIRHDTHLNEPCCCVASVGQPRCSTPHTSRAARRSHVNEQS